MSDQEIRAKALEYATAALEDGAAHAVPLPTFFKLVSIYETYIRLGADAIEGMVKEFKP